MIKKEVGETLDIEQKVYRRKVNQVGHSLSVNTPKELAKLLEIQKGEELQIKYEEGGIMINKAKRVPEGVRPEILKAMNRSVMKYDKALRNLKER